MFIIVWKGRGYIVVLAALGALMAGALIRDLANVTPAWTGMLFTATMGLAGIAIWFFARKYDNQPGRVLIDKKTGREFTVRRGAGSFFFVATRHWAYILPGLAALGSIYTALTRALDNP